MTQESNMTIKILGVVSSMREGSYGTRALKMVLDAAEKHEAKTRLLALRIVRMPMFIPIYQMKIINRWKK